MQSSAIPASSKAAVQPNTTASSFLMLVLLSTPKESLMRLLVIRCILPVVAMMRKTATIAYPTPPSCMSTISTTDPKRLSVADMSTGVRPVTQTADVDTKNASRNGRVTPS